MADSLPALSPALSTDESMATLARIFGERLDALPIEVVFVMLFDIVDESALSSLAWQFNLLGDGWELAESEDARRSLLKRAIEIKRHKGTPWAVRETFRALGFGEIGLVEGLGAFELDGSVSLDGSHTLGDPTGWARYSIVLDQPITLDQADSLRKVLRRVARRSAHLQNFNFRQAAFRLNGTVQLDGSYTLGVV